MLIRHGWMRCVVFSSGIALAAAGCAQPSRWSRWGGSSPLVSRDDKAAALQPGATPQQVPSSSAAVATPAADDSSGSFGKWLGKSDKRVAADAKKTKSDKPDQSEYAKMCLARLREKKGHPDEAEPIYREVLQANPKNGEAWHRLAVVLAGRGKFDESNECFSKSAALLPPTAEFLGNQGYSLYLQQRLSESETVLRKAMELDPQNMSVVNNLGLVLGNQGRFDESLAMFKRAGSEAQAHANLGYVYTQVGELDHAQAHYNHALTLDKNLKIAAKAMIQVAEKRRQAALESPPTALSEKPKLDGSRRRSLPEGIEDKTDEALASAAPAANLKSQPARPVVEIADRPLAAVSKGASPEQSVSVAERSASEGEILRAPNADAEEVVIGENRPLKNVSPPLAEVATGKRLIRDAAPSAEVAASPSRTTFNSPAAVSNSAAGDDAESGSLAGEARRAARRFLEESPLYSTGKSSRGSNDQLAVETPVPGASSRPAPTAVGGENDPVATSRRSGRSLVIPGVGVSQPQNLALRAADVRSTVRPEVPVRSSAAPPTDPVVQASSTAPRDVASPIAADEDGAPIVSRVDYTQGASQDAAVVRLPWQQRDALPAPAASPPVAAPSASAPRNAAPALLPAGGQRRTPARSLQSLFPAP